jgi:hypothetical protein
MMANQAIGDGHIHEWESYLHMASVLVRTPQEHHCKCCAECSQLMCETASTYDLLQRLDAAIANADEGGAVAEQCTICDGIGRVTVQTVDNDQGVAYALPDRLMFRVKCPWCQGTGNNLTQEE